MAQSDVTNAFDFALENSESYSTPSKEEGKLTVTPATLTIVTESAEKQYDGDPLTADGSATGYAAGESADFEVTGTITDPGNTPNSYTIVFKGEEGATDAATATRSDYTIADLLDSAQACDGFIV